MATTVLDPAKEPSRFLTIAYVLALSLIAALTLGSHFIIAHITASQKQTAEIVYIAGRQRMLAQQIVFYAETYYREGKANDRQSLDNAIFNFELGHRYLTREETSAGHTVIRRMSPALRSIYFEQPYKLDDQIDIYLDAARELSEHEFSDSNPDRTDAYQVVSNMAAGALIIALEKAAQSYQDETLREIRELEKLQLVMAAVVLAILLVEAIFIFRPLVDHVQSYSKQLLKIALKDPMTGLDNRRAFMERMEAELARPDRRGYPMCVVLCDIDKFKAVNDTYGHDVGDRVIQHFASVMKRTLRTDDIIARIGGEEFAIVLRRTGAERGFSIIDRLRGNVEKAPCSYGEIGRDQHSLSYTASFGVYNARAPGLNIEQLLKKADEALYEAKKTGRNKVVMAAAGPEEEPDRRADVDAGADAAARAPAAKPG